MDIFVCPYIASREIWIHRQDLLCNEKRRTSLIMKPTMVSKNYGQKCPILMYLSCTYMDYYILKILLYKIVGICCGIWSIGHLFRICCQTGIWCIESDHNVVSACCDVAEIDCINATLSLGILYSSYYSKKMQAYVIPHYLWTQYSEYFGQSSETDM